MITQNDKNLAFLTHLSGFGGYIFPLGSVLIPLVIWQTKKEESKFIDENGKQAVNFNLSYLLYTILLGVSSFPFFIGSFFKNLRNVTDFENLNFYFNNNHHLFGIFTIASLISVLAIGKIIWIIKAVLRVQKGEEVKYPLTIKFIK